MIRVVETSGTPSALGEQQGQVCSDTLQPMYDGLRALPLAPKWMPAGLHGLTLRAAVDVAGAYYLARHRKLLSGHAGGRYLDALRGLASGFDARPSRIYGFNAFEIESANPSVSLGCTALAFSARQTAEGAPLLAYNHDFPPSFERFLMLRRSQPRDAAASLCVTYPALVGAIAGVNEHGLAATLNQAFATDIERGKPALLLTILVQECLDHCRNVAEAVELIEATPVTNGGLLTLVDSSGARAVMELSATRRRARRSSDDVILYAFNKYMLPELQAREVPVGAKTTGIGAGYDIHATNISRERRYREILREGHAYSQDDIRALLADHDGSDGGMNTICCHGDALNMTILSAIIDPLARDIRLILGRTCQGRYERYSLETRRAAA